MQSVLRSNCLLIRHHKCLLKESLRWSRFRPIQIVDRVVDKPPDFYPTIDQKLNQINYYENAKNLVDIGFGKDSDVRSAWTQIRKVVDNEMRVKEELDDLDDEEMDTELNYHRIYDKWLLSEEGIQSTIDLANHYAIFRDLFPPDPQMTSASAAERIAEKPIYFFSPLVPIKAEFCANESEVNANDITIDNLINKPEDNPSNDSILSPVYRGNILFPRNCLNCPNVTIDSSAINGINNMAKSGRNEEFSDEVSGQIKLLNDDKNYYTLCLINLDSHFGDESNVCHWMAANIHNKNNVTNHETAVKYLPVYGIKGLGYHRFAFVLYQHKSPLKSDQISDYDLRKRKFNAFRFMSSHGADTEIKPVGLSWFQTTWDYSSQKVFHNYLEMRSPYYEWMPPNENAHLFKQLQFPARAPFNIYLDRFRDPKDIAKDVLCQRLKSIDPYNYDNMFDKPRVSPQIHPIDLNTPEWTRNPTRKKRGKTHAYRGLRPHSAIEPHDNNADLDRPKWPRIHESVHPLNQPIPYPDGHRRPKLLKDTHWVKPPHEHPQYRVDFPDSLDEAEKSKLRQSE